MQAPKRSVVQMERLQRWGVPALVGMLGLALTVWVWQALEARDWQLKAEALRRNAEVRLEALERVIAGGTGVASGLAAYFAGSSLVEAGEWPVYGQPLLDRHAPSIVSLQWAPRVWEQAELRQPARWSPRPHYPLRRVEHEAVAEAEADEPQPIRELDAAGAALVVAEKRDQHFPLMYQVMTGDRWAAGFDWWSNPMARAAMTRAVETGKPALSRRLDEATREVVTGQRDEVALLIEPVFFKAGRIERIESVEARWEALKGFVVVGILPAVAFEQAIDHVLVAGIDLHLFDVSDENAPTLLGLIPSRLREDEIEPFITPGEAVPAPLHDVFETTLGGREVLVYATPTEHFMAVRRSWVPELALGSGLVASGLLAALLASMLSQTQLARHEAAIRHTHAQQQSAVARLGLRGLQEPSLVKLMDQAVDLAAQILAVAFASVLELEAQSQKLRLVAGRGWSAEEVGGFELEAASDSLASYTLRSKEPVVVADLPRETRFRAPDLERHGVISGLSTPIVSTNGVPCGVLGVYDTRSRQFTEEEVNFLQAVANILGQAIVQHRTEAESRRLNDTLEQRVAERTAELENANEDLTKEVAERQEAEQRLQRAQAFLDSIIENIPHMLFLKDAKQLRFVRFNTAGETLLGYTRDELIGKNDYDFFPKEEADFFTAKDREVLGKGQMCDIAEESIRTRHRGTRILHTKKVPLLNEHGEPAFLLGISEDITERKQAQWQLEQMTGALARSNQELEQFAYVASHDLQEPLRKVEGFGQMLQEQASEVLNEQAHDYLGRMFAAIERMRDLINGLLTYSRVTTKTCPFERVNLNEVVSEVVSDLELRIEETQGRVEVDELPTITADRLQMRQLLQNLIANALKFHKLDEPPRVRVYAEADEQSESGGEPRRYRLLVEDNGIGIDPKYGDQLFVPFRRLHGRGSPYSGTGIGLAVCRKIVERHDGTIRVDSAPDQGSTFIATLPREQPEHLQSNEESRS